EVYEKLVEEYPAVPDFQHELGGTLHNWANRLDEPGKLEAARPLVERAIVCQRAALKVHPDHEKYREFLRNHYSLLATVLHRQGKLDASADANRQAITLCEALAK